MNPEYSILDQFRKKLLLVASAPRGGSTFSCELIGVHDEVLLVPWNAKAIYMVDHYRTLGNSDFKS